MYDVWDYLGQLEDRVRLDAYARALRAEVRPHDVVLDMGCGLGVFAVLAAKLGARRVYGVDPNSCIALARDLAEANGVADRVTWFRGGVEDVAFPEAPTLVVADVRGSLPFYVGGISTWNSVRSRLAPGARTIPRRDVVQAVPVRSDRLHARARGEGPVEGVTLRPLTGTLTSHETVLQGDEQRVGEPLPLVEIRYLEPFRLPWSGQARFVPTEACLLDGFALPFEADLAAGVSYPTMGPGCAKVYPTPLAPLPARVQLAPGTPVTFRLRLEGDEGSPSVLWAVDVGSEEGPWQGRLAADPLWIDVVRTSRPDHVPGPDAADDLDASLLSAFARQESLASAIARARRDCPTLAVERVEQRAQDLARRRQRRRVYRFGGGA